MIGHAAPVSEILDALKRGGYDFGKEKYADKNLRISLGKNSQTFVQVKGSDSFGLLEFYPDLKRESKEEKEGGEPVKERKKPGPKPKKKQQAQETQASAERGEQSKQDETKDSSKLLRPYYCPPSAIPLARRLSYLTQRQYNAEVNKMQAIYPSRFFIRNYPK